MMSVFPLYEKYADIVVDEEDKDLEGSLPGCA